jgi:hypothetical protein
MMRITKKIAEEGIKLFVEGKRFPEIMDHFGIKRGSEDAKKLRQKMQEIGKDQMMEAVQERRQKNRETVSKIEDAINSATSKEQLTKIVARLNSLIAKAKDKENKL